MKTRVVIHADLEELNVHQSEQSVAIAARWAKDYVKYNMDREFGSKHSLVKISIEVPMIRLYGTLWKTKTSPHIVTINVRLKTKEIKRLTA